MVTYNRSKALCSIHVKLLQISQNAMRKAATVATIGLKPYKLYKLNEQLPTTTQVNREEALKIYTEMITIRKMENAAAKLYRTMEVRGFCHLYTGQEACAVGIHSVMRPDDCVITSYRCHSWAYLMAQNVVCCLSELTGRQSGISKGKGGSMHMYTGQLYGGNGIVGAQVPQGAGVALALKYLGKKGTSITVYGDGAANQGQVFEAYNMAKLWNLPCIFLCENNHYAMGTSLIRGSGNPEFYKRGDFIPGIWVDGMDVLTVREAAKFALEYCSSGRGPLVVEASTYRFAGHSMSDPDTSYRTRDEVMQRRQTQDPIKVYREQLISAGLAAENDFKKIDSEAAKIVAAAIKVATTDKELPVADLTFDICSNDLEGKYRGVTPWSHWVHGNRPKAEMGCNKNL